MITVRVSASQLQRPNLVLNAARLSKLDKMGFLGCESSQSSSYQMLDPLVDLGLSRPSLCRNVARRCARRQGADLSQLLRSEILVFIFTMRFLINGLSLSPSVKRSEVLAAKHLTEWVTAEIHMTAQLLLLCFVGACLPPPSRTCSFAF